MFVRLVQLKGFGCGAYVPLCHKNGPFSWRRPSREEHLRMLAWLRSSKWDSPRTTIQPYDNLIGCINIFRREEPEIELVRIIRIAVDRKCAGIGFTNVEINFRNACTIDREFYGCQPILSRSSMTYSVFVNSDTEKIVACWGSSLLVPDGQHVSLEHVCVDSKLLLQLLLQMLPPEDCWKTLWGTFWRVRTWKEFNPLPATKTNLWTFKAW